MIVTLKTDIITEWKKKKLWLEQKIDQVYKMTFKNDLLLKFTSTTQETIKKKHQEEKKIKTVQYITPIMDH